VIFKQEDNMGMYTEVLVKAQIKRNINPSDKCVLDFLFNGIPLPDSINIPDHEFFKCNRWQMIGSCSSYYHIPWPDSGYREDYVFSRSDLKAYDDEDDKFFDWFKTVVDASAGSVIGWTWYEENDEPSLVRVEPFKR
jgi:hypothetical protein